MLVQRNVKRSIALIVILSLFIVAVTPNGVVFGETIDGIKDEMSVNEVSDLIDDAVSTESVVTDFEKNHEEALTFDGSELLVSVSTDPEEDIKLSDGLGNDMSIGLPDNLKKDTKVLTGRDGTVLYKSEDKSPDAELAVQAIDDGAVSEGIRMAMIINNASADHEYDFILNLPEGYKVITSYEYFHGELDTGELLIVDENNEISKVIEAPWAKDANGNSINTKYVLKGNTLTQVIDFKKDTAFPVVADPFFDDLKCAATIALYVTGAKAGFAAAKGVIKAVNKAGSIANAVKALVVIVKEKIKGSTKDQIAKALVKAGIGVSSAPALRDYIVDILGLSDIKKYCVMEVY